MTRQELITSRKFWVAKIHANLWVANGSVEADSDKYEEMAEKIVDARFMTLLKEIEKLNPQCQSNDTINVCHHDMTHFSHKDSVCSECGFVDEGSHEQTVR